mmetsp:Transcript_39750/g.52399  ORF Transcript_39750/g.52399 Transcript_39750/m.52399 type:complete len:607 (+) Transcript_39750:64-1884(+)
MAVSKQEIYGTIAEESEMQRLNDVETIEPQRSSNDYGSMLINKFGKKGLMISLAIFAVKASISLFIMAYAYSAWLRSPSGSNQAEMETLILPIDREVLANVALQIKSNREFELGTEFTPAASADQIISLPGLVDTPAFLQFSGYLDISSTKHNFYWFTESERDPVNDPLVFWTNGGPGCSGFIGFMGEMGPFRPQEDMTLKENELAWNKLANMVYIEQPCGVGFSYSDEPDGADYHPSDSTAAADNLQLVLQFLERYPHLKSNVIYLSAESYGGHYLPSWAKEIVLYNDGFEENSPDRLNFGGFLVGNPYTDPLENMKGMVGTFWGHQLIPEYMYQKWVELGCDDSIFNVNSDACSELSDDMFDLVDELDPYALDFKVCHKNSGGALSVGQAQRDMLTSYIHKGKFKSKHSAQPDTKAVELPEPSFLSGGNEPNGLKYDACTDNYMTKWLNLEETKEAIHANTEIEWKECSNQIHYHYEDEMIYMEDFYKFLIDGGYGLKIMVYSGDDDSICGTIGTQSWIWDLDYPVLKDWSPWMYAGQVAGYETRFEGLRFVTVHGAGHEVPAFKPGPSIKLLAGFLDDSDLDETNLSALAFMRLKEDAVEEIY